MSKPIDFAVAQEKDPYLSNIPLEDIEAQIEADIKAELSENEPAKNVEPSEPVEKPEEKQEENKEVPEKTETEPKETPEDKESKETDKTYSDKDSKSDEEIGKVDEEINADVQELLTELNSYKSRAESFRKKIAEQGREFSETKKELEKRNARDEAVKEILNDKQIEEGLLELLKAKQKEIGTGKTEKQEQANISEAINSVRKKFEQEGTLDEISDILNLVEKQALKSNSLEETIQKLQEENTKIKEYYEEKYKTDFEKAQADLNEKIEDRNQDWYDTLHRKFKSANLPAGYNSRKLEAKYQEELKKANGDESKIPQYWRDNFEKARLVSGIVQYAIYGPEDAGFSGTPEKPYFKNVMSALYSYLDEENKLDNYLAKNFLDGRAAAVKEINSIANTSPSIDDIAGKNKPDSMGIPSTLEGISARIDELVIKQRASDNGMLNDIDQEEYDKLMDALTKH